MDYGIIGNCKTAALVAKDGTIEWTCLPNFDSPSVFAKILDPEGGHFGLEFEGFVRSHQYYLDRTNILCTEFTQGENVFRLLDFMPRYSKDGIYYRPLEIHRILQWVKGSPKFRVAYEPKLNYALEKTEIENHDGTLVATSGLESLFLYSSLSSEAILKRDWITLTKDEYLLLTFHERFDTPPLDYVWEHFHLTKDYWENWCARCKLPLLYQNEALRSALVLKLLTFEPTGAIVAAATTSLPEAIGENRNWDYRFCWLRDSSLMLEALKFIGHFRETHNYFHFLMRLFESKLTRVQIMYGIDGRTNLEEFTLPHLRGYKNSVPVRIGNFATHTKQNDIFGEVLNSLYLYFFHYKFEKITDEAWSLVKFLVETTVKEWATEDAGIWELRHIKGHFTFSKVLSWVALDRGILMAEALGKERWASRWRPVREEIRRDIETHGYNPELKAYTQSYGSSEFDASLLLMNHYGFLKNEDPVWINTVRLCDKNLVKNGYAFRYTNVDDFGKPKSAFIVASFWLASALCSIGDHDRAKEIFENVLARANHLCLLSEDIEPKSGDLLGNFPQAYSHMALIIAARDLSQLAAQKNLCSQTQLSKKSYENSEV